MIPYTYSGSVNVLSKAGFAKDAKEHVYWICPKFSEAEVETINTIRDKLGEENVIIYEYGKSILEDKGRCFSLEDEIRCIDIQLLTGVHNKVYDSLLVVDNSAYNYDHEANNAFGSCVLIENISEVKLKELKKEIQSNIIQINLFGNTEMMKDMEFTDSKILVDNPTGLTDGLLSNLIVRTDIELKLIQDKICRVNIRTPGIRTDDRNIDISCIGDIIGKPDKHVADRLSLRWKIFGRDKNVNNGYQKLQNDLERIKEDYLITINSYGRFILQKDKPLFERVVTEFKSRLKQENKNFIQEKIDESKEMLDNLAADIFRFAENNSDVLKTCSRMELETIVGYLKSSFPTVEDVIENSDVELDYISMEREDILNKEFSRQLLEKIGTLDNELTMLLEKIVNT
ncbi:MAG: hypothetical protein Q8930_14385 [Bacillota bacterium]|nr:hypothetical protein [Bacillota bacterium]